MHDQSGLWGRGLSGLALALSIGVGTPASAWDKDCGFTPGTTYGLTDISVKFKAIQSYAPAINNRGQIVVDALPSDYNQVAFIYKNGQLTSIPRLPGDFGIYINAINGLGKAVGESTTGYYPVNPILYFNGKTTSFPELGSLALSYSINNLGSVVGNYIARYGPEQPFVYINGKIMSPTTAGNMHSINNKDVAAGGGFNYLGYGFPEGPFIAYTYKDGKVTYLGTLPGHTASMANAINEVNQVAGVSEKPGVTSRAFLYDSGNGMKDLGLANKTDIYSVATAINDCGQVVGFSGGSRDITSTKWNDAFLYANGKMMDLNSLIANRGAFRVNAALGINNYGQIVGRGSVNGGCRTPFSNCGRAFALTPHRRRTN